MPQPRPFSLAFDTPALESGFDREYRREPRAYYRMLALAILGFLLIISLVGTLVTFSVNRQGIQQLLWFALIPLTAVAAAALHARRVEPWQREVVIAYVAALAAVCALYPWVRGDRFIAETYGFSYVSFVLLLALAFGRFAPRQAVVLAAVATGAYAAAAAATLGPSILANHVPLILGAAALGFAVGYLGERNSRQLYAARVRAEDRESRLAESEALLRLEQQRSEALINAMLPAAIAERLRTESVIADGVAECSVLFGDLVGSSALAQELGPRALVSVLNQVFSRFDELCAQLGLEKIKTIGDAYMAAAGVPQYVEDHPVRAADMALAMVAAIAQFNRESGHELDVRVGLHCGPAVAGVIGTRKYAYDLWGDSVNVASRMESHGAAGRVHISEAAAKRLKRTHVVEERGTIEVKGLGPMKTYWLVSRKTVPERETHDAGTHAA